ncbi:MAG: DUF6754 domain-containing protein [Planctomycetaceae bacterium]|nr:DUF6754 domain-containing protein [Planctomycetaceae bacterium]
MTALFTASGGTSVPPVIRAVRRHRGDLRPPARLIVLLMLVGASTVFADAPRPPRQVTISDRPNDAGTGLKVTWELSPDDVPQAGAAKVVEYHIFREVNQEPEKEPLARVAAGNTQFDDSGCNASAAYRYAVKSVGADGAAAEDFAWTSEISPQIEWFDRTRLWGGVIVLFVCAAVIVCTEMAKQGRQTYVRPIAGLTAIDEAVGRATEMGRPMLFVPGIMDLDEIETVAGLTVLAHVGEKAAVYDTRIEVPTARSLVMTAAREALAGAYLTAGRAESFNDDCVYYVTEEQFGYVAAVCGWMSREKPAACFYLGKFFAESLVLAETGNACGAIQLAGTAESAQLPFFVAACDYTLIGEELFAASAYLSGEPQQLGTLKGQDVGKVLAATLLILGSLLATGAAWTGADSAFGQAYRYLIVDVLNKGVG